MNRIILAYSRDNAEIAETTELELGRIGIPFEHITGRPGEISDAFSKSLSQSEDPVVLFITENLLKSHACMDGLLPVLQQLARERRLTAVVADGKIMKDGAVEYVETHFDRMGHALQYMNFWQSAWLDLSARHQHASGPEKEELEKEMNAVHRVANDIGEVLGALKETGYIAYAQFKADDYAVFFKQMGLQEWHEQYKQLTAGIGQDTIPPIPETAPHVAVAATPVVTGLLAPEPSDMEGPNPETSAQNGQYDEMDALLHRFEHEEEPDAAMSGPDLNFAEPEFDLSALETEEDAEPVDPEAEIDQSIRDAWFWLEKGHTERGLELLQFALEQHPENERLKNEYHAAAAKFSPQETEVETEELPFAETGNGQTAGAVDNEAKSYELMGDMAAEKGDYLFAKYCWDRAAEIDPAYPGIFRKLGLMTSEHLVDYRETAVHYLKKALEAHPEDADVHLALAGAALQNGDTVAGEHHYTQAVMLNPSLRTPGNDKLFHPQQSVEKTSPLPAEPVAPARIAVEPQPLPVQEKREVLTVLITGATSGIGRATAEIFARNGHRVIITGRRIERLVVLKTRFEEEFHSDVLMLPFDVRDQGAVQAALDNLPESWQNIDILVNNAGLAKGLSPIQEGNLDHWETMIDTNVKGLLYVTRAVAPGMVARRRGHIVNLGSSAGKEVYPNGNVYCATKFAVDALTRAMRLDLHAHNIRVSQVSPGHVEETEFAVNRFDGDAERAKIYNDFQPLKPADIADVIWFVATRPPHVNIQDVWMFGTQQASSTVIDRSGRK
ncbi:MAG: SDR family NAD(P)-dependent oxidoreductase [Saprospiraceae bacterium]|nr:SDR family NAD(P)-dependent oxidoreductase [Saprospiraceae bacterium]